MDVVASAGTTKSQSQSTVALAVGAAAEVAVDHAVVVAVAARTGTPDADKTTSVSRSLVGLEFYVTSSTNHTGDALISASGVCASLGLWPDCFRDRADLTYLQAIS